MFTCLLRQVKNCTDTSNTSVGMTGIGFVFALCSKNANLAAAFHNYPKQVSCDPMWLVFLFRNTHCRSKQTKHKYRVLEMFPLWFVPKKMKYWRDDTLGLDSQMSLTLLMRLGHKAKKITSIAWPPAFKYQIYPELNCSGSLMSVIFLQTPLWLQCRLSLLWFWSFSPALRFVRG